METSATEVIIAHQRSHRVKDDVFKFLVTEALIAASTSAVQNILLHGPTRQKVQAGMKSIPYYHLAKVYRKNK